MREHDLDLSDFNLDEIEEIELIGEEDTIDITVEGTHMFYGNGIYTHNSAIKSDIVEADQIGGSIKKGQIGHFIVSIAKSLEQKENGTANMAILKSRFGKDGVIFDNIIFDNKTVQIDMSEGAQGKTFSERNEAKSDSEQHRVNNLMIQKAQKRKELLETNNEEDIK